MEQNTVDSEAFHLFGDIIFFPGIVLPYEMEQ